MGRSGPQITAKRQLWDCVTLTMVLLSLLFRPGELLLLVLVLFSPCFCFVLCLQSGLLHSSAACEERPRRPALLSGMEVEEKKKKKEKKKLTSFPSWRLFVCVTRLKTFQRFSHAFARVCWCWMWEHRLCLRGQSTVLLLLLLRSLSSLQPDCAAAVCTAVASRAARVNSLFFTGVFLDKFPTVPT